MALTKLLSDDEHIINVLAGASEVLIPPGVTRFRLYFDNHSTLGTIMLTGEILLGGALCINQVKRGKRIDASTRFPVRWPHWLREEDP